MTNITLVDAPLPDCPGELTPPAPTALGSGEVYVGVCRALDMSMSYTNTITATAEIALVNTATATISETMVSDSDTVTDTVSTTDSDSEYVIITDPTLIGLGTSSTSSTHVLSSVLLTIALPLLILITFVLVRQRRLES